MTNIFLSWRGGAAKEIAVTLRKLLKVHMQGVNPFMSDLDIDKGLQWRNILDDSLRETRYGMFIITPEAHDSVWMAYEAGAIGSMRKTRQVEIMPLLFFDEGPGSKVPGYLADVQGVAFNQDRWEEVFKQIEKSIQNEHEENISEIRDVGDRFECFWQILDQKVTGILRKYEEEDFIEKSTEISNNKESIPPKLIEMIETGHELNSSSFDKILGIEKKIDNLFNQFGDFQARLTPALTESGFLRSDAVYQSSSVYPGSRLTSSIKRLNDIVVYIQENDLLDENTLQKLRSTIEELS